MITVLNREFQDGKLYRYDKFLCENVVVTKTAESKVPVSTVELHFRKDTNQKNLKAI